MWNQCRLYSFKASACSAGDPGSIPGLGRSPGEGNGNPLQYSCLENSMGWGAWEATVHRVAESDTHERLHRSLILDQGMNSLHFPRGSGRTSVPGLCVSAAGGAVPPSRPEKSPCFSSFTSLETLESPPLFRSRVSSSGSLSTSRVRSFQHAPRLGVLLYVIKVRPIPVSPARPAKPRDSALHLRHHSAPYLPIFPEVSTAPWRSRRAWTSTQRTTQPGAALWRLNRAPSRPSGVGAPRAGCAPSPRLEPALSVASPFGHVLGSLLSADPGDRDSKRPPGRSRAGLHAPGDQQEGSDSGVFCQLPRALLSRRPSELPELAVSGHPGLGAATHGLTALQKPRNQGRLGTPECWENRHPSPLHPCVW